MYIFSSSYVYTYIQIYRLIHTHVLGLYDKSCFSMHYSFIHLEYLLCLLRVLKLYYIFYAKVLFSIWLLIQTKYLYTLNNNITFYTRQIRK